MSNKNKKYRRSIEDAGRISDEQYYNIMEEVVINRQRNEKKNGGIYITPSKRGTFTAAASKHDMGVQEFASKILRNKDSYSPDMVKKANFARNASKWNK